MMDSSNEELATAIHFLGDAVAQSGVSLAHAITQASIQTSAALKRIATILSEAQPRTQEGEPRCGTNEEEQETTTQIANAVLILQQRETKVEAKAEAEAQAQAQDDDSDDEPLTAKVPRCKPKDLLTPKRPARAYSLFMKEIYPKTREEYPEENLVDLSRHISERWRNLVEASKDRYRARYRRNQETYCREMNKFKKLSRKDPCDKEGKRESKAPVKRRRCQKRKHNENVPGAEQHLLPRCMQISSRNLSLIPSFPAGIEQESSFPKTSVNAV
ncbi:hypothetical protein BCR43DRAFT_498487 [Syncephalastrum racemosum]|uniref:HMG box domain-containing protein n=1 Tax=Syncephalastrum racemosum TaxID=13706 RepID=A0A1X2H0Y2_SYNRA|nr:hypothetical protein BCR43DRAFT_498487 [Syncephalastrum racemosum]